MRSSRIWIVSDQSPVSGIGVYSRQLYRLLRPELPNLRFADLHYFPHAPETYATPIPGAGTARSSWRVPSVLSRNYRSLGAMEPEVDLWQLNGTHYPLTGGTVPSVATVQDFYVRRPSLRELSSPRQVLVEGYSAFHHVGLGAELRRATRRVAVSERTRASLKASLNVDATLIYHWIDPERFRPRSQADARAALGLPSDRRMLLSVGSAALNKNRALLSAVAELLPDNLLIVKVGAPPVTPHRRIRHLGTLSPDLYPIAFNAADLYLHTSLFEGFGHPLLEALASDLPVVATDAPVTPELLGDAAELVPSPYAADAFAAAIHRALEPTRYDELLRRARTRAARFSPEVARAAYLSLYSEVLGS